MPIEYSRDLVLKKLRDCFPDEGHRREVLAKLDGYQDHSGQAAGRIHLAVLKQCAGNANKVDGFLDLASLDFRDLLVGAEYPEQFLAPPNTPKDKMAILRERDRRQYEAWLLSDGP